jgi:regulatory protein
MKILLYKVNPVSGGEEAELYVELTSGENSERSKFTVSAEMFFELGFSVDHTGEQELSREKYEEITLLAGRHAAVKRGLSILSFGDNTKKGLASKLRTKGFSREESEYASEYLASAGYINEAESAVLLARDMAEKKLYGARRIAAALFEKGFAKEAIQAAADGVDVDFAAICRKRIEKMGGRELFAAKETKQKAVAALLRYGFSYGDIKEALKSKKNLG